MNEWDEVGPGPARPYSRRGLLAAAVATVAMTSVSRVDANAAVLQRARTYRAEDHGIVGDWTGNSAAGSGTNDSGALQRLINSIPPYSTILFNAQGRYRLDYITATKSLVFDFNQAEVITQTQTAKVEGAFLRFDGTEGPRLAIENVGRHAATVMMSNSKDVAGFRAGDDVIIRDSTPLRHWASSIPYNIGKAEVNTVKAVNKGALILKKPMENSFTTQPTVSKVVTVKNAVIRNVGMMYDTDPGAVMRIGRAHIFRFRYCVGPLVENVRVLGWQGSVANFENCRAHAVRNIAASKPFRPSNGGHGHTVRAIFSADGIVSQSSTYGARHLSNYVGSVRCGSSRCVAHSSIEAPFQTHGWGARASWSDHDTVVGGDRPGWALGNSEFGADHGYTVTRSKYTAAGLAFVARSGSDGLIVRQPEARCKDGLVVGEGATNVILDVRTGYIAASQYAILAAADIGGGRGAPVGNLTIRGAGFRGRAPASITIGGFLRATGVPERLIRHAKQRQH